MENNIEKITNLNEHEIDRLYHELTYRRYMLNKDKLSKALKDVHIPEYIILYKLMEKKESDSIYGGRLYLHEVSDEMSISITETSKVVKKLESKGFVEWSHDGDGSSGTYISITSKGIELVVRQEDNMHKYYGHIIEKFGRENLIQLLKLMKQLETVIDSEYEEAGL